MTTPTLKYGMKVQLFAKSPLSSDTNALYGVTIYDKHNLIVLDDGRPITFTVLATSSTSQEVCHGDRVILADENGLVWNSLDTNTWGKGYVTLKDKAVSGELHFIFTCPSQPLSKGSPIILSDCSSGGKLMIHVVQKGASNKIYPLTIDKKTTSAVKGGYIRSNGTGSPVTFDLVVVDNPIEPIQTPTGSVLPSPTIIAPPKTEQSQQPHQQQQQHQLQQQQQQPRERSGSASILADSEVPGKIEINSTDGEPSKTPHRETPSSVASAGSGAGGAGGDKPARPLNPSPFDPTEESEPLRYGDRIKLRGHSAYNPDGGYVGVYHKHKLVGIGPVLNLKTGRPIGDSPDGTCKEFTASEFIVTSTGRAKTGDIVRYSSTVVLVNVSNGNTVWNCKDTDTWGEGYVTEGGMSANAAMLPPNTPGPPLVSSTFSELTGNGKPPTGQMHVSLQPDTPLLLGYPIHNNDNGVYIDVENTHQKGSKYNSRISVYKRKSSQLAGGYIICLPNAGKPVSFTIERVTPVPVPKRDPFSGEHALVRSTGYVPETETTYRRDNLSSKDRKMFLGGLLTIGFGLIAIGYALARGEVSSASSFTTLLEELSIEQGSEVADALMAQREQLDAQLYFKQVFYMICTFICAIISVYLSSTAVNYVAKRVKVVVERNDLAHLTESAHTRPAGPNDWMIEAGIDPDNIDVPQRYIDAEKGDQYRGKKRYVLTMKWRHLNKLDSVLSRPHPLFRVIKKNTNQFFYGRGKDGNCVYYETPKAANLADFDRLGVTIDELLFHFVYITEYLYQVLDSRPDARCISVVDCTGVGMSDLTGNVADFLKQVSSITQTHYPERSAGIICINAPFAFRLVWNLVKGMMDPVTRSKTHIYGSDFVSQMSKYIDADQIPEQFGGSGRFTPSIPDLGPTLPSAAIDPQFNAVSVAPLSKEEEDMFNIADKMNIEAAAQGSEPLPRPVLTSVGSVQDLF